MNLFTLGAQTFLVYKMCILSVCVFKGFLYIFLFLLEGENCCLLFDIPAKRDTKLLFPSFFFPLFFFFFFYL